MIFNPNAPVPGNKDGVYPEIPDPVTDDYTSGLKDNQPEAIPKKMIDPRSQLKTSQQPRGNLKRKSKVDQPVMDQIPEENDVLSTTFLETEIPNHASRLK